MKKLSVLILAFLIVLLLAAPTALAQSITGDKVVMGENYVLRQGETLDGNLAVFGGSAEIEPGATVHGDLSILGGSAIVDGLITGNVTSLGGSLQLNETAVLDGNLANLGGSVNEAPGAVVRGDRFNGFNRLNPAPITPTLDFQQETPRSWFSRFINWQLGTVGSILLMGLLSLVLVLVAPRAVSRVASAVAAQPGLAFIFGFLTLILGILAGAILLIACGLGLLVWLVLTAASVLGWVGVSLWLGQRLLTSLKTRSASSIGEVLLGVVLITLLSRLPCIGWLCGLVFGSLGLGAVVLTRFGTQDANGPSRTAQPLAPRPVMDAPLGAGPLAAGPLALPPASGGGTGGDFAPLPEPTDLELAAPPFAPSSLPAAPDEPVIVAPDLPASVAPVEPVAVDDTSNVALPEVAAGHALTDIVGIAAEIADKLQAAGITTVAELAALSPTELAAASGVSVTQVIVEDWVGQAQRLA